MSPLLELIGASVAEAVAYANGVLELLFSNSITLETFSTTGYEAWHFQFPPGRTASRRRCVESHFASWS